MDKFLANLYQEEMQKQAAADFDQFLDEQPISQLEELLGIRKHAVAEVRGDVEAPLPDSLPGHHLDAKMKLLDQFVAKSRGDEPPTRAQASEVGRANFGGPSTMGKEISAHHPADGKPAHDPTEKKAEMMWADRMGKKLAAAVTGMPKQASLYQSNVERLEKLGFLLPGAVGYLSQGDPEATPKSGFWRGAGLGTVGGLGGALAGHALGGSTGATLGGLAGSIGGGYLGGKSAKLSPEEREQYLANKASMLQAKMKSKESQGDGGGQQMAGQGAGQGITSLGGLGDTGVGEDKTTLASVKAKIASRALRATEGAPEHIKRAAAALAGRQMSKEAILIPTLAGAGLGAAMAPEGEAGRGAGRGGLTGLGAGLGMLPGALSHVGGRGSPMGNLALMAGGGALGGLGAHALAKKLMPYKKEQEGG